jgi:hypothetical protein
MKLRHAFIGAGLLVGVSASAALAAGYGLWPTLPTVAAPYGLTGNEQVPADTGLANGAQPQTEYISVPQMRAVQYLQQTPLTAFTITVPNGVSRLLLTPAGTLATGTITLPANPVDGQEVCLYSTQTQTALTLSANTGQTISNAITAMTANTRYCYDYAGTTANAATAANWYRSQ